jgi:hypothetical protein
MLLDSSHRELEEFRAAADESREAIKTSREGIALLNRLQGSINSNQVLK